MRTGVTYMWREVYLKEHQFPSTSIPISEEFRDFLVSDGIIACDILPQSSIDWTDDENSIKIEETKLPFSASFHKEISFHLSKLGSCVPKIGNSTPKDAVWITTEHTLECRTPEEIYELLKASDRISLELSRGATHLVLIKWAGELDHCYEFRCFIHEKRGLVGVTQRDDTVYYAHLGNLMGELVIIIKAFLNRNFKEQFVSAVVDLYFEKSADRFIIIDVQYGWDEHQINPILFSWLELKNCSNDHAMVRVVENEKNCRLSFMRLNNQSPDLLQAMSQNLFHPE